MYEKSFRIPPPPPKKMIRLLESQFCRATLGEYNKGRLAWKRQSWICLLNLSLMMTSMTWKQRRPPMWKQMSHLLSDSLWGVQCFAEWRHNHAKSNQLMNMKEAMSCGSSEAVTITTNKQT